jgi:hypothetical protein
MTWAQSLKQVFKKMYGYLIGKGNGNGNKNNGKNSLPVVLFYNDIKKEQVKNHPA